MGGTHRSLHPLLTHHADKHTFPDLAARQTHPDEITARTQMPETKFQMPSKALLTNWFLNKKPSHVSASPVAHSEHPADAPLSILRSQNERSQQMLPTVFLSMAEPPTAPVLQECQDEGVPCTSPPHAACSRSASHFF